MTLKCLIADDEERIRMILRKALTKIGGVEITGEADNGVAAVELMERTRPHCVLMDVEMPGGDGVTAAKQMIDINPKIMIVFITAHEQYMPQAFELYAFDYMVKPFRLERLRETIGRIARTADASQREAAQERENARRIYLKTRDGDILANADDIVLAQRENRATVVITRDAKYYVNETLSELEEKLPADIFMRSHRSYIINVRHLKKLYPYGRWTYVAEFSTVREDALVTAEKAKELPEL
jgi:two-component system LytT family response regulator